jgi:carboxymethylenebutenolidase
MCDDNAFDDMIEFTRRKETMSRRTFSALTVGAGLTAACSTTPVTGAIETKESEVVIKTADGSCDAYFVHPAKGKSPGVLVWPDIFGLRPAFKQMGKRLAESGYAVLVINPFYRLQKAPTAPEHADFTNPETRAALLKQAGTLSPTTAEVDAKAFVPWLDSQAAVDKKKKLATTGYCMGGPYVFRTAAIFPDRIGAAATFHGGGLVANNPNSPHLLIPKMKASFLIAVAQNDDAQQPDAKDKLREAFAAAKLPAEIEVYKAQHGWCPPDAQVYNRELAERAWDRQLVLFKKALA